MFSTVTTTDLVRQIARQIARAITEGRLKPGERLTELRLSKEFGTSRAPVREAARLLESQGLVVSSPRRGFFVRTLTATDLKDIYELRMALELHGVDLALRDLDEAKLNRLKAQLAKLFEMAESKTAEEQIFEDLRFHRMLCEFSGNARLLKTYDDLAVELTAGITLIGKLYDDPQRIAETHVPIIEALERRSRDELRGALEYHIGYARDQIVDLFSTLSDDDED